MNVCVCFPSPRRVQCALIGFGLVLLFATVGCSRPESPDAFKISVARDGVYAVPFSALESVGLKEPHPSADLELTLNGDPLPIWVEDGGDGEFGPGDHLEFLGSHAPGERSYFSEHDVLNHYRLAVSSVADASNDTGPLRYQPAQTAPRKQQDKRPSLVAVNRHLEEDKLLVRFAANRDGDDPEPWYWARLTQIDKRPWNTEFTMQGLNKQAGPVSLRVGFRGWSKQQRRRRVGTGQSAERELAEQMDHHVEVRIGKEVVGVGEWNAQDDFVLEVADVSAFVKPGRNVLQVLVPRRTVPARGDQEEQQLVDVVLLNWVEIGYRRSVVFGEQGFAGAVGGELIVAGITERGQGVALAGGERLDLQAQGAAAARVRWTLDGNDGLDGAGELVYAPVLFEPEAIVADLPSALLQTDQQADYLMIAPRHLAAEVEPLADFHRARGLSTKIVDIADVFDEFSHGQPHPDGLRDFIKHAYHEWQDPAPRFVLLVGDASWDVRNLEGEDQRYADWTYRNNEVRRFAKNGSTSYSEELLGRNRNLIPTWRYHTYEGQAASDNYFAMLAGDDFIPELAVGRFPVTEPEEVRAIVQKTIRYMDKPEVGPWRRAVLWVTNESKGYQRNNEKIASKLGTRGYDAMRVYPQREEADNVLHQQRLLDAFNEGVSMVNFIGHGGRYIWRTGPPDPAKNHDLFTLDHLDELQPNGKLPVVVSLTCYSAPFDHPTADSIGEKFLRMSDRGAIGVFAASWRNSPTARLSESVMGALADPEFTSIGEAVTYGKSQVRSPMILNTYNYFGDPAVPLARPVGEVGLQHLADSDQVQLQLRGPRESGGGAEGEEATPPALGRIVDLDAQVFVEWLDPSGVSIREVEVEVADGVGSIGCEGGCGNGGSLRAYAWAKRKNWDAVGSITFTASSAAASGG